MGSLLKCPRIFRAPNKDRPKPGPKNTSDKMKRAYLYWNQNGYIVRDRADSDKAVGFSSKSALEAVEEAEANGYEVYWLESPVRNSESLYLPRFNRKPIFT